MNKTSKMLPKPVIQRLPKYLTHVHELTSSGIPWVSSHQLADQLGFTSSTVRQDLSHLSLKGVSKRGYHTGQLVAVIRSELGADTRHRLVIVGAGYLGCAMALHGGLAAHGFETFGLFDNDPEIIGTKVGDFSIRPVDALKHVVKKEHVEIGLIAVPPPAAQEVADRLVEAGIKGILNLAYCHVHAPKDVVLIDARFLASLQELAYAIRCREEAKTAWAQQPEPFSQEKQQHES